MRFRIWLLSCFLMSGSFLVINIQAQYLQKPLRRLTPKDGLPQSFISGLVQDKEGFVWIGTRNGLARYDGMHFKLFRHSNKDSSTLASNLIISLLPDKFNHIWIEHESSNIDRFDPVTETIEHVTNHYLFRSHPVKFTRKGWTTDTEGNLWCIEKSNGLYKYDWKHNEVSHFTSKTNGLASDTIRGLLEDLQQNMWIVTQHGISRYDEKTGNFTHTLFPFEMDFNTDANLDVEVITVHERKNGEIMFGDRKQLFFFNPHKNSFRSVTLPKYSALSIHSLQTGPDGYEYIESEGIVYRYNDKQGLIPVGDIGLATFRNAQSFLIDRSGLIWLGTNAAGIHQIDLSAPFFESHATEYSFHYDLLRQQDILLDEFSGWPLGDKQFKLSSYFFRSAYDSRQRLWLALRDKVGYCDFSQKKYMLLPPVPGISSPEHLTWGLRGISFAPNGTLWVISDKDYIGYFDTLQQKWITFLTLTQMKENNPDFTLNDLVADNDKLWITNGSGDGLFCIDINSKAIKQYNQQRYPDLLPTNLLLGLKADPTRSDILWIGTYEGLICLNKKTFKSEVFSIDKGLPDNTIYAIQTDKAGYLWLSTNKGLCRFHPVTHEVRIFGSADGLPGDEFNRFHSIRLPDGRLAFGGTDGWALFDPTVIKPDNYQPPVSFTNLKINNEPVEYRSIKNLLSAPLNSLKVLSLPYDQNTLAFEFAGLEFNEPKKILYRYQLKNIDNKWIITDNPAINYSRLPAGHYTLNINASNTTGKWSSQVRTLSIIIRPPFWRTWWAYTFYVLFIAGLIWIYIRYKLTRERLKQEVFLKEKESIQLKAVDELKTRFFSNITHEFRTPLTLILTPIQRLRSTLQQQKQLQWAAAVERNANQLLRLINQLLDFSKLESGSLKVNETRGNICDIIEEFLLPFYDEARANDVHLKFTSHCNLGDYWFDVDKLEQIIRNLVANALKFTSKGGKIEVICHTESVAPLKNDDFQGKSDSSVSGIFITVRDTGIGIPQDQLPYIFNRFYQIDNASAGRSAASHPKGSGIGLALVKELVDLQGGTIEASSSDANADTWHTIFNIWLPYKKATGDTVAAVHEKMETTSEVDSLHEPESFPSGSYTEDSKTEEHTGATILIIEDNDELAAFIADSLPGFYNTNRAANGAEGLEMAFNLIPDLVISDVLMPVMDGYECCRKLKSDERTSHIPVIMLTAKASYDNRIQGLTQGADDYVTKPFHIQELRLRVNNLLERQRIMRQKLHLEFSQPGATQSAINIEPDIQDAFMKKLHDIIEEKLDDTLFGVEDLAARIGMSRTTLYRKLKSLFDMPAGDIIRNYRLKRATQFLKEGHNSSETAYLVGFDSPAYFTKCFKEFYQITPFEFIQKNL